MKKGTGFCGFSIKSPLFMEIVTTKKRRIDGPYSFAQDSVQKIKWKNKRS
jgi:hypothetical protein